MRGASDVFRVVVARGRRRRDRVPSPVGLGSTTVRTVGTDERTGNVGPVRSRAGFGRLRGNGNGPVSYRFNGENETV